MREEIGTTSDGFVVYRDNIIRCKWDACEICPETGKFINHKRYNKETEEWEPVQIGENDE